MAQACLQPVIQRSCSSYGAYLREVLVSSGRLETERQIFPGIAERKASAKADPSLRSG
jgi:hypothetical protein